LVFNAAWSKYSLGEWLQDEERMVRDVKKINNLFMINIFDDENEGGTKVLNLNSSKKQAFTSRGKNKLKCVFFLLNRG